MFGIMSAPLNIRKQTTLWLGIVSFFGALSGQTVNYTYANTVLSNQTIIAGDLDDTNIINLAGKIQIDGNVILGAKANCSLSIALTDTTTIFPSDSSKGTMYGHLILYADRGAKITVDVDFDLFFTGSNKNVTSTVRNDLNLTFSGLGQCEFQIASGKSVHLTSLYDNSGTFTQTMDPYGAGVRAYLLMDHPDLDVYANGVNKVVVSRKFSSWNASHPDAANDITFAIGRNSFITFASINKTGLDAASAEGIVENETQPLLSAALAFDVSCPGPGRTILKLEGCSTPNTYRDGALCLRGHLVENGFGVIGSLSNADHIRLYTRLNKPAGGIAMLRVTDEKAYQFTAYKTALDNALTDYLAGGDGIALIGGQASSRGLWILNTCNSMQPLAMNSYRDGSWFAQEIYNAGAGKGDSAIQPGLILGINGQITAYHNTFVNHLAGRNTRTHDLVAQGMTALHDALYALTLSPTGCMKKHNPSALIVDGYTTYIGAGFRAHLYDAAPKINLLGAARLFVDSAVTSYAAGGVTSSDIDFTIGSGTYDGFRLNPSSPTITTTGEGEHVMDVQGLLYLRTFADDNTVTNTAIPFVRHAGTLMGKYSGSTLTDAGIGEFIINTIRTDYTGDFVDSTRTLLGSYPLTTGTYSCFNRPCINLNNDVFVQDVTIKNYDVMRDVNRDVASSPVIVGGENIFFSQVAYADSSLRPPTLWFENAAIHCHESMCVTGVRFSIRDYMVNSTLTDNVSKIVLFNHGNTYDLNLKGYGRVFQLGSTTNKLSDDATAPLSFGSAYVNIFKNASGQQKSELVIDTTIEGGVLNTSEHAFQILHMVGTSTISLGWTSTQGIISKPSGPGSVTEVFPWYGETVPVSSSGWTLFNLDTDTTSQAKLRLSGDLLYFSSFDSNGVMYVNHGGSLTTGSIIDATSSSGSGALNYTPKSFIDINVKVRVAQSTLSTYDPTGSISVPFDQVTFLKGIMPYNIDSAFAVANSEHIGVSFVKNNPGLSCDLIIPWTTDTTSQVLDFKAFDVQASRNGFNLGRSGMMSRSLGVQRAAVTMPTKGLLKFDATTEVEQLRISGATAANPFAAYFTGDDTGYASVREIVSIPSTDDKFVPGEGAFAALFMDQDARIGLGSRFWNDKSIVAWNQIGRRNVTLVPNGNSTIILNENIIITDAQPILPTTSFGANDVHRIVFFAEDTREIRIPAGGEFDLSAFGNVLSGTNQQIVIGGKVRLIFEAGSTLRFPNLLHANAGQGPVLYVNDQAELIFEGLEDKTDSRLIARNISDPDNIKVGRCRIMGIGKIWLNKDATMKILESACVGIESDTRTPETDILISIQKEAAMLLGDPNTAGGVLQVGNPVSVTNGGIYFTLRMDGPRSLVHIDREGIFGLAAGVKGRYKASSSGKADNTLNNVTLRTLFNVRDVTIRSIRGSFSHNQIYDGTDSQSSLMAIGNAASYTLDLGTADESIWRGGGNMIYVAKTATDVSPLSVSVASIASPLVDEYNRNISGDPTSLNDVQHSLNNGKITLMGSGIITRQVSQSSLPFRGSGRVIETMTAAAVAGIGEGSSSKLLGGQHFTGPQADMFRYLGFTQFTDQTPSKYCVLGSTQFEFKIGYVLGTSIVRSTVIPLLGVKSPEGAAKVGALLAATVDANGNPSLYTLPEVPKNPNIQFVAN